MSRVVGYQNLAFTDCLLSAWQKFGAGGKVCFCRAVKKTVIQAKIPCEEGRDILRNYPTVLTESSCREQTQ